ncbi:MAG: hypothetical protein F6J87_02735, partial [Spirulina sp. SIO3F2]|nr:hypothetical protein [Spirulina sp. SIO3F2]
MCDRNFPNPLPHLPGWLFCLGLSLLLNWIVVANANAGPLSDRLAAYPNWPSRPPVTAAEGELVYPDWLAGTWQVTSPLLDAIAPLAPEIVTPGFAAQQAQLNQTVQFRVRFGPQSPRSPQQCTTLGSRPLNIALPPPPSFKAQVVADRVFNGTEIARAYLGQGAIQSVTVDPCQPNRQITRLNPSGTLIATVTHRASEALDSHQFIATELTNQVFRLGEQVYINDVETTTHYHQLTTLQIDAEQITAIYLSPQDPDYFQAG